MQQDVEFRVRAEHYAENGYVTILRFDVMKGDSHYINTSVFPIHRFTDESMEYVQWALISSIDSMALQILGTTEWQ